LRVMTGSLKRHPSEDPEESPKAKRHESPGATEPSTAAPTEASPTAEKIADTVPAPPSFLSPPTKIGGVSITEKVGLASDKGKVNGNSTSILSSGFSLASGSSLFSPSNGSSFASSSKGTNIFSAALSNVSTSGGIFGSASSSSSSGFVFGGNMSNRVVAPVVKESEKTEEKTETPDKAENADEAKEEKEESSAESNDKTKSESKSESKKVSLKELEVTSGEEDEKRIMQTSCKLYQFCPVGKTWIDRGGGTLRLNEREQDGVATSRLVVRSKAVMRVMLNTKLFADMIVNRANLTTIRISALDEGRMSTYLLKCTRNECDKLHTALLKKREDERHKVGDTVTSDKKVSKSEQPPTEAIADLTTIETLPNPSDPKTNSPSDDKTVDQKVVSDDKKSKQKVASKPEKSTEEDGEDAVPESHSDKTVNGAKSHGVTEKTSESETPKGSTDKPEKTVS